MSGFSAVGWGGGYWFYLPPMFVFFTLLTEIVREKERKMRTIMATMGLSNAVYWTAWFLQGLVFCALSSAVLIACGLLAGFDVFLNCNLAVLFALFFLFGAAMAAGALLVSTLLRTAKAAQTFGYGIVLVGFVLQTILSTGYGALIFVFYSEGLPAWAVWIRRALNLYPPFNMSLAYYQISKLAASNVDIEQGMTVPGPGFAWRDLWRAPDVNESGIMGLIRVDAPTTAATFSLLLCNMGVFLVLTWYLDQALEGSDGAGNGFLFFVSPSFWRRRPARGAAPPAPDPAADGADPKVLEEDAKAEAAEATAV